MLDRMSRHTQGVFVVTLALALCAASARGQDLPAPKLDYSSYALTRDGAILDYIGDKFRIELPSTGSVSKHVIHALLATEDRDFYNHDGVSYTGLGRALLQTLTGRTQGGSTLTMQLARNLYLTHDRTISRKMAEIDIARALERRYTKDQLLLLYLNTVYFGNGAYGISAAAQQYFSKTPDKLTVPESALLVGLLKAPSGYNPLTRPDKALSRRNEVMHNLVEVGRISDAEYRRLRAQPLGLTPRESFGRHAAEYVRREASAILQTLGLSLASGEFRVITTIDAAAQKALDRAIEDQWKQLPPAMRGAQVGAAAVEPGTGAIRALAGGNPSAEKRGLIRATQIRRQAGSSFKPFLYATLLEEGLTLAEPIDDVPIVVDSGLAWEWRPANDDGTASGAPVPLIDGVRQSLNLVAAHAVVEYSSPARVVEMAQRCGITSPLPPVPSIALGTGGVSPLEMAAAMGTIASGGIRARPHVIARIEDRTRRVIWQAPLDTMRVLDEETCALVTTALAAAVDSGTGASVRRIYTGAAAGKTGTTQNSADAWFVGYTAALSTAVWVGFDMPSTTLKGAFRYGGTAAAPIWARMMRDYARVRPDVAAPFVEPDFVQEMEICTETGMLAGDACEHRRRVPVKVLELPVPCTAHGKLP